MSKLDYGYNIPALKGMKLEEIQTPCLLIDYETFKLNVEKMRSFTHENNIKLRPHAKMHKSVEVAKYQLQLVSFYSRKRGTATDPESTLT